MFLFTWYYSWIVETIYRKTASKYTLIHRTFKHPTEHKSDAFRFILTRKNSLHLFTRNKRKKWNTLHHVATTNLYPILLLTKLYTGMLHKATSPAVRNTHRTKMNICVTFIFQAHIIRICHISFVIQFSKLGSEPRIPIVIYYVPE
jgi:hypothetical protein